MCGRQPIMQTIMAGKMEMVLPAMYMMNRFMGICFSGARATSQQRCKHRGIRLWKCTIQSTININQGKE
uniref:Uncharacterized protein n=1 Tax=Zonotrichia albicollis TaxID=44394 RepID=A0A8D2QI87_ZONAL